MTKNPYSNPGLIYWTVQAMLFLIAAGWIAVDVLLGQLIIALSSSCLFILYALFLLRVAPIAILCRTERNERIALSCIAILFSISNMAGILMNFVPMLRAHAEKDFFPIRPIAYVGLLASVFAFIFSDVWPGGFWIRALIGAVLGLLTVVLVNTANATTSAESCR